MGFVEEIINGITGNLATDLTKWIARKSGNSSLAREIEKRLNPDQLHPRTATLLEAALAECFRGLKEIEIAPWKPIFEHDENRLQLLEWILTPSEETRPQLGDWSLENAPNPDQLRGMLERLHGVIQGKKQKYFAPEFFHLSNLLTKRFEATDKKLNNILELLNQQKLPGGRVLRSSNQPIWNLPHPRNPHFTGRGDILSSLHAALTSGKPATLTQAITGLGGIGKTQIALEYAYRYADNYLVIWWLHCEEPETLASDYAALARRINLPEQDLPEQQMIIEAVRRWLEQHSDCLLIFDNVEDFKGILNYLPRGSSTQRVLITSRHPDWGNIGQSITVQTWPREDSKYFLCNRTAQEDNSGADKLAEELGDLPLALEQAAAYINATKLSLQDYLDLFRFRRKKLWGKEKPAAGYHENTVATTWQLAMETVKETTVMGVHILNLCAFLAPEDIPRSLLGYISEYLPGQMAEDFKDPLNINEGIQALIHYSLIAADTETLSIHRLVQTVVSDMMLDEEKRIIIRAVLKTLNKVFPNEHYNDPRCWPTCSSLLPHAQVSINHVKHSQDSFFEVADILYKMASYLHARAFYSEAESLFRHSLSLKEVRFGLAHLEVASVLKKLGKLLHDQGKFAEAEEFMHKALSIRENQLGPNHPDVAGVLNDMASLFQDQKKYDEAEPLYKRALMINKAQLGNDDPYVATCLKNLGMLLRLRGEFSKAEELMLQALKIDIKHFGENHRYVARGFYNLALLYKDQTKYAEAEKLMYQALSIRETQLGNDHPDVATSLYSLAELLCEEKKYGEAVTFYRRSLEIRESKLGKSHPKTLSTQQKLELLYSEMKSVSE